MLTAAHMADVATTIAVYERLRAGVRLEDLPLLEGIRRAVEVGLGRAPGPHVVYAFWNSHWGLVVP